MIEYECYLDIFSADLCSTTENSLYFQPLTVDYVQKHIYTQGQKIWATFFGLINLY